MVITTLRIDISNPESKLGIECNNRAVSSVAYLQSLHCNPVTNKNYLVVRSSDSDLLFN